MVEGVNNSYMDEIRSLTSSDSRMRRRIIINSQRYNMTNQQPQPVSVLSDESISSIATPTTITPPKRKQQELVEQQPDPVVSLSSTPDIIKYSSSPSEENEKSNKRQKRRCNNKYYPDKPMSKEEETIWRRDARRKRNRESARASRAKVQDRIAALEKEVELWKNKYHDLQCKCKVVENNNNSLNDDSIVTTTTSSGNTDSNITTSHLIENNDDVLSPCYTPDSTLSSSLLSYEEDNDNDPYTALDKDLWHLDLIHSNNSLNFLNDDDNNNDDFSVLTDIMMYDP